MVLNALIGYSWGKIKQTDEEKSKVIKELQTALERVKTLSGMLPICASCKKIRDDKGYWNKIEAYIEKHSEAEFSHGICPECARKLYPEYFSEKLPSEE
jgi:DNA repair exonuclease SbcCD ATPase subunit